MQILNNKYSKMKYNLTIEMQLIILNIIDKII